jgi:hypothetical protein
LIIRYGCIIISLLLWIVTIQAQVTITGKVISKLDTIPLPGANVIEKGTNNETTTNIDGEFSIKVADSNAVLIFEFIGMIPQEIPLKGRTEILVKGKWDCNKDFFDSRQIVLCMNSGIINNPVGFLANIESPYILGGVIKGTFGYQTNLKNKEQYNEKLEFSHFISNCDFDMDFLWDFRQVTFKGDINTKANSFEAVLNLRDNKFIAGYSRLDYHAIGKDNHTGLSGILLGVGTRFNLPLYNTVYGKVAFYKNKIEYQAGIQGEYRHFDFFLKYYKINTFNELSLGIGISINY